VYSITKAENQFCSEKALLTKEIMRLFIPRGLTRLAGVILLTSSFFMASTAFSQTIIDSDTPTSGSVSTYSGRIVAGGWAINPNATTTAVTFQIDGRIAQSAGINGYRPDVCNALGKYPGCPNVGYSYFLNTLTVDDGLHNLLISVLTSDGKTATKNVQFYSSNGNAPTMAALNYACARCDTPAMVSAGINTGAQWAFVPATWVSGFEPAPPTLTPQYSVCVAPGAQSGGEQTYCSLRGPYTGLWHNYYLSYLDYTVQALNSAGVQVAMQVGGFPGWAGSPTGCDGGNGQAGCGVILTSYMASFKNNFADFAYFLAQRYPKVNFWVIGEEPNNKGNFSPQPPLPNGLLSEAYMELMMIPATTAIKSVNPNAVMGGPEIDITCMTGNGNAGGDCFSNDGVYGYQQDWTTDWAQYLIYNYPTYFDKFTFHDYDTNPRDPQTAVGIIYSFMTNSKHILGIWETEMNAQGPPSQSAEADMACNTYKNGTWERAFYYGLSAPGYGIVNYPSGSPVEPIYSDFAQIVRTPKSSLWCVY
jgi:hypothetical protein